MGVGFSAPACSGGTGVRFVVSGDVSVERAGKSVPASFDIPVKRVVAYSGGDSLAVTTQWIVTRVLSFGEISTRVLGVIRVNACFVTRFCMKCLSRKDQSIGPLVGSGTC
ncbi:hypothetical protein Rs2_34653 [Raphanus sativus]|nr:hypothetical protein Rs2_46246 [Raphanus sativus]KAJ4884560.1 hypothetical protein Rs2_34653 [Raphanus sativus]